MKVYPRLPKKLYALYREGSVFLGAFTTKRVAEQMRIDLRRQDSRKRNILLKEYEA